MRSIRIDNFFSLNIIEDDLKILIDNKKYFIVSLNIMLKKQI